MRARMFQGVEGVDTTTPLRLSELVFCYLRQCSRRANDSSFFDRGGKGCFVSGWGIGVWRVGIDGGWGVVNWGDGCGNLLLSFLTFFLGVVVEEVNYLLFC